MTMAFTVKDGVPSMRFETHDSGSMLFRHVDIDLATYPMLAWRWFIELPIRSPLDERTREGDDHPARLFLRFITDRGENRAMEVIWGNRLKPGIINTSAVFRTLSPMPTTIGSAAGSTRGSISPVSMPKSGDAAPTHVVDVAVFCDSDDTHTASISYFAYVRLERR